MKKVPGQQKVPGEENQRQPRDTAKSVPDTVRTYFNLLDVPGEILIAVVPKLKLYGFWRGEGQFAEFLRILENQVFRAKF
jgi:hypothetical protein